ncbi:MAG: septal ring lytic transglycosylase RlpA family protein [Treponema sp.]
MRKYWGILTLACFFLQSTLIAEEIITLEAYASYYGEAFNGRPTSSGEIFDMNQYTAAHKTLPFGTLLEVTNLENGKKVIVRVNDRGPFIANREIDVSKAAAESLGMLNRGITRVSIKKVDSLDHAALVASNEQRSPEAETSIPTPSPTLENNLYYRDRENSMPNNEAIRGFTYPLDSEPTGNAVVPSREQSVVPSTQPEAQMRSPEPVREEKPIQAKTEKTEPQDTATQSKLVYKATNSSETPGILWRIQLGAFTREENALRLVVSLRKIGFEPAYEKGEKTIRVVLPGIRPSDMKRVKEALNRGAFTDYIIRQEGWE